MSLDIYERDFGSKVLTTPQARVFYRSWRRRAITHPKTWTEIRDAKFSVGAKEYPGTSVISGLRAHLVALQKERCCYCRRHLDGTAYGRQLDHILPKHIYRRFTFSYRNLAVSCYNCNHSKRGDNWSTWPATRRRYITARGCGSFFHARFHDYDAHIRYVLLDTNGASISIYAGLTPQGRHLCANLLNKSAKRTLTTSANPRFSAAMDKLRAQVGQMAATADDSKLMDFMEALELAADQI